MIDKYVMPLKAEFIDCHHDKTILDANGAGVFSGDIVEFVNTAADRIVNLVALVKMADGLLELEGYEENGPSRSVLREALKTEGELE